MDSRPADVRDERRADGAFAQPATPPAPVTSRPAGLQRTQRLGLTFALAGLALLGGTGLSLVPRAEDEVTRQVQPIGDVTQRKVPMEMARTGRGFPFRTLTIEAGPAASAIHTHAAVDLSFTGIALNLLLASVGALLVIVPFARKR
jgi:hypothetical protein